MPGYNGNERIRIVSEEAAYWYVICTDDEGNMQRSDKREFFAWMRRSPENIAELFKIAQLDGKLRRVKLVMRALGLGNGNVIELAASGVPYQLHRELTEMYDEDGDTRVPKKSWTNSVAFKMVGVAASVMLGVGIAFFMGRIDHNRVVQTGPGQWQHIKLEDGSVMHVDARTRVKVDFTPQERIVNIYEGNALFDVEKDHRRPFIVRTHLIDAIAVGTRYGVAIEGGVTTTVSEGTVRVTPRGEADGKSVLLHAGDELYMADTTFAQPSLRHVNADRKFEWANGWLVFQNMKIADAAKEFNKRNSMQIQITEPGLGDLQLKGFYRLPVAQPEQFARILDHEKGVAVIIDRKANALVLRPE